MSKNPNHPKAGSKIKVEPIRKEKDIKLIKKILQDNPRNLCLFTLGINTNLRASDLLQIKAGMVRHLQPGDDLEINERKTGKPRRVTLNRTCVDAIQHLLDSRDYDDEEPLFVGQRGRLTVPSINWLAKQWC